MGNKGEDCVTIHINGKLNVLNSRPSTLCPFKVPDQLLMVNKKAYEPEIISIGPYHRHKDCLKPAEEYKFRFLQMLLRRRNEDSAGRYVEAMRALQDKAHSCYAEPVSLDEDEFVEMMVLDGCFIIELIRSNAMETLRYVDDPIFQSRYIMPKLKRDMFLLENQLPFFVLSELFQMTPTSHQEKDFSQLIFEFFSTELPERCRQGDALSVKKIEHFLGFVHDNWLPSTKILDAYKLLAFVFPSIPTATKLVEAGIKFCRNETCSSLFDIEFEKGKMLIPALTIDSQTETILGNLIAYEHFSQDAEMPDHVLDYTVFMHCLIDSAKDVELLQQHGIIVNWLGDNEAVATLFDRLGHHVVLTKNSCYSNTFKEVNNYYKRPWTQHCERPWIKWMAQLWHDHFNSPWALISFLAAVVLLLLTLLQTIYSYLSYNKQ